MSSPSVNRPLQVFQTTLALRGKSIYITRPADDELFDALRRGELCYVLAPRQIGKSSLRMRTADRLRKQGTRVAMVDLSIVGARGISAESWHKGLAHEIADQVAPQLDFDQRWRLNDEPVVRAWTRLIHEIAASSESPLVIFLDELDTLLSLPFSSDDFLLSVRAFMNEGASDPILARLTFCLMGVTAPGDLLPDDNRTPFNAGREIMLEDFTREELDALSPYLARVGFPVSELLDAVYYWTSGHPYMTQRICENLSKYRAATAQLTVQEAVQALFLHHGRRENANLTPIENYFARGSNRPRVAQMLNVYHDLLQRRELPLQPRNQAHADLQLVGLAARERKRDKDSMRPRNRITAEVFDLRWVRDKEAERALAGPLSQWLKSDRSPDYLLRGKALREAQEWAFKRDDATREEREYVHASLNNAHARDRQVILALVLLVVAALPLLYWAISERLRAEAALRAADEARILAQRDRQHADAAAKTLTRSAAEAQEQAYQANNEALRLRQAIDASTSTQKTIQLLEQETKELRQSRAQVIAQLRVVQAQSSLAAEFYRANQTAAEEFEKKLNEANRRIEELENENRRLTDQLKSFGVRNGGGDS